MLRSLVFYKTHVVTTGSIGVSNKRRLVFKAMLELGVVFSTLIMCQALIFPNFVSAIKSNALKVLDVSKIVKRSGNRESSSR
jgi:hypothetical protein